MLNAARKLHALDFAIHWLRPKSKIPVESGWTKGARKTFDELKRTYTQGLNVGVRLGTASRLEDGFLAVIDVDVKSPDPKHQGEALAKLKELFPEIDLSPWSRTGRGNGSGHYLVRTGKPGPTRRLAQSRETVKVHMPSSLKASVHDRQTLNPDEIEQGYRIRTAWEIAIMGEGSQIVLPPSIHPDTGKQYIWGRGVQRVSDIPLIEIPLMVSEKREKSLEESVGSFAGRVVDLPMWSLDLPKSVVNLILTGEGCSDRSASLFKVAGILVKENWETDQILTLLTDGETFLGQTAYEHTKSQDRTRAMKWVFDHTLKKARAQNDARLVFEDLVEEEPSSVEETAKEIEAFEKNTGWKRGIERSSPESGGKPKNTMKNVRLILENTAGKDIFKFNEFTHSQLYGQKAPWGGGVGQEIKDIDVIRIKHWLAVEYRFEPANDRINDAISKIADENAFHPVRDYLDTLEWDGAPRMDTWLKDYLEADAPEPYLSAISRKVLCAMVARIYRPGVKFDTVLILEGNQGVGKSTAVRALAGDDWFSDTHINIADKDAVLSMQGVWVTELGELSGMGKADVDQFKEFVSRPSDRIRVPYGRRTEEFPRQGIFIGTTNSDQYLKDLSGGRRFAPVAVGKCDFNGLREVRDQLFAEAKLAYQTGEPLYLEHGADQALARIEQESRTLPDIWVERLLDFFESKPDNFDTEKFTLSELFLAPGVTQSARGTPHETQRLSQALKVLGYQRERHRGGADRKYYWVRVPASGGPRG